MRDLIEGGRDEDLVTTLLRAIDLAKSSRSGTTVYLLNIALLNEGILLASDLARKEAFAAAQKELSRASGRNFVDAERPKGGRLPSLRSARREVVRPRS